MKAAYLGHEALTFSDYIDLTTGKTLTATPGGVYDIAPASGRNVPDLPAQWFTPVKTAPRGRVVSATAGLTGTGRATGKPQPE